MDRRQFLGLTAAGAAAAALARPLDAATPPDPEFELEEITLAQLQDGMRSGRFTAAPRLPAAVGAAPRRRPWRRS